MNPWILASAVVIGLLGAAHLVMLYASPQLRPADAALAQRLRTSTVPLSADTNLWRLWFGFNTSHALGALGFAATYGYLALAEPEIFAQHLVLSGIGLAYLLAMLLTSLRCWFRQPSVGIAVGTLTFLIGAVTTHLD